MSNSKVNTSGIYDASSAMQSDIAKLESFITSSTMICKRISSAASKLASYNGMEVSGSRIKMGRNSSYEIWNISGADAFIENSNSIVGVLAPVAESLDKLNSEILNNYSIADEIDSYIENIQKKLEGYEIDTSQLSSSFESLKNGIAYDDTGAANGNFISSNNILTEYWTDKTLKFVKQDNGTYMAMQADENGNMVTMGFVTAGTVATYLSNLSSRVIPKDETISLSTNEAYNKAKDAQIKAYDERVDNGKTANVITNTSVEEVIYYYDETTEDGKALKEYYEELSSSKREELYNDLTVEQQKIVDEYDYALPENSLSKNLNNNINIASVDNKNTASVDNKNVFDFANEVVDNKANVLLSEFNPIEAGLVEENEFINKDNCVPPTMELVNKITENKVNKLINAEHAIIETVRDIVE